MRNLLLPFLLTALLPAPPGQADTTIRIDGSHDAANTVVQVKGGITHTHRRQDHTSVAQSLYTTNG